MASHDLSAAQLEYDADSRSRQYSGEYKLLAALLMQSLKDFFVDVDLGFINKYANHEGTLPKGVMKRLKTQRYFLGVRQSARRWFFSDCEGYNSFLGICDTLGLNARAIREGLNRLRAENPGESFLQMKKRLRLDFVD